jgi:metal-sulfur cluster biosynthetic enzyme
MSKTTAAAEAAQDATSAETAAETVVPAETTAEPTASAERAAPAAEQSASAERAAPAAGESAPAAEQSAPATEDPEFDVARRATELAVLDALRSVIDPELGLDVVDLALIRQIVIGKESSEVKMVLTTPFCPYAGSMVQQIKDAAESVLDQPVKVTVLAERWDPREAGLMW